VTVESGSDNTVLTSLSELRAGILGDIAGKASFEIRRNSSVSPGTDKADYFTIVGLEYSF
jgi:putative salt-induced outer membrane protein YdiY